MSDQNTSPIRNEGRAQEVQTRTVIKGYFFTILLIALAYGLRAALDPLWGERLPYATFFIAELVAVQFVAAGPYLLLMVVGFLLSDWTFVAPRHSFHIGGVVNQVNAVVYFVLSFGLLYFSERTRRALAHERSARQDLARLAAIVESSDDGIIGKSLDGTILSWNSGAKRLYGYSPAEAIGKNISILLPPNLEGELSPLFERVSRGEPISHFESLRRTKDGRVIPVSLSISPVRDSCGGIVGAATIARDISERKRAEEERERLLRELQAALANVKTLSGLLPICASCKKIRDDKGYWNQIEIYIRDRSDAQFTHGICPECAQRLYPEACLGPEG